MTKQQFIKNLLIANFILVMVGGFLGASIFFALHSVNIGQIAGEQVSGSFQESDPNLLVLNDSSNKTHLLIQQGGNYIIYLLNSDGSWQEVTKQQTINPAISARYQVTTLNGEVYLLNQNLGSNFIYRYRYPDTFKHYLATAGTSISSIVNHSNKLFALVKVDTMPNLRDATYRLLEIDSVGRETTMAEFTAPIDSYLLSIHGKLYVQPNSLEECYRIETLTQEIILQDCYKIATVKSLGYFTQIENLHGNKIEVLPESFPKSSFISKVYKENSTDNAAPTAVFTGKLGQELKILRKISNKLYILGLENRSGIQEIIIVDLENLTRRSVLLPDTQLFFYIGEAEGFLIFSTQVGESDTTLYTFSLSSEKLSEKIVTECLNGGITCQFEFVK